MIFPVPPLTVWSAQANSSHHRATPHPAPLRRVLPPSSHSPLAAQGCVGRQVRLAARGRQDREDSQDRGPASSLRPPSGVVEAPAALCHPPTLARAPLAVRAIVTSPLRGFMPPARADPAGRSGAPSPLLTFRYLAIDDKRSSAPRTRCAGLWRRTGGIRHPSGEARVAAASAAPSPSHDRPRFAVGVAPTVVDADVALLTCPVLVGYYGQRRTHTV
jgi:hypothetical protein